MKFPSQESEKNKGLWTPSVLKTNLGPSREKLVLFACTGNEGPDQPVYPCSITIGIIRLLLSVHAFYCIENVYSEDFEKKKYTSEIT